MNESVEVQYSKSETTKVVGYFLLFLLLNSCSYIQDCNSFEREIKSKCIKVDTVYSFYLNSLTDFKWDELYIISASSFSDEVEEIIGIKYDKMIDDGSHQYIFVRNSKIVREFSSQCGSITYYRVQNDRAYVKYQSLEQIHVKKQNNGGTMYYMAIEK